MSAHPVFLIVRAKLADVASALEHMNQVHAQQLALRASHPNLYSSAVHVESLVTNVQGIYTQLESVLKTLAGTIDGYAPSGEAWHRDLLLQVSAVSENRPGMIGSATTESLTELLKFRHAVRHSYPSALRQEDVFRNVALLQQIAPVFLSDMKSFEADFG